MSTHAPGRGEAEDGFTLIELMVVVLVVAILLAVAVPTFLGARERAGDRAAQSDLRNAVTAAKVVAVEGDGSMTDVDKSSLTAEEGSLRFDDVGDTSTVGVVKSTEDVPVGSTQLLLYKGSPSGTFFGVVTTGRGVIAYCKGADAGAVAATGTCVDEHW